MSDERYEIRSKIGQGGVGAVYRAFDRHLNREVAIKRVLTQGGYENREEATKAMLNEAASLSSVTHPNIVTIFDSGVDKEGPFVVMELLSGRTLNEMIDRGALTMADFREVAVQSQEALIAAQDLDLVHHDIKPTNLMVTWLPGERLQIKLVDFGLAEFSPKPSRQTIDRDGSVFGSIHFMAPEQFERTPLDKRTDIYSMGCVYYYCLAGVFPFGGKTAPQVMEAHLQHRIVPLQQHRPDLPEWLCQWVMWQLARNPEERPLNSRKSLNLFLMNEKDPSNENSRMPRVTTPDSDTSPQGPSAPVTPTPLEPMSPAPDLPNDRAPAGPSSPPPLVSGTRPPIPGPGESNQAPLVALPAKKGMSGAIKGVIASLLLVAVIIAALVLMGRQGEQDRNTRLAEITAPFADQANPPTEIKLSQSDISLLLNTLITPEATEKGVRETYLRSLEIGKPTDNSNIDDLVARFATETAMSEDARRKLFLVLQKRSQPAALGYLIDYARETTDAQSGKAALKATEKMASINDFGNLLEIVTRAQHAEVQQAAVKSLGEIIKRSSSKSSFPTSIISTFNGSSDNDVREGLLRLLGCAGGPKAAEVVSTNLKGSDPKLQLASIAALREWPDTSQFKTLHDFVESTDSGILRKEGFSAMVTFLTDGPEIKPDELSLLWKQTATLAQEERDQIKVINAMTRQKDVWAYGILDHFIANGLSDPVTARAEDAKEFLKKRLDSASEEEE